MVLCDKIRHVSRVGINKGPLRRDIGQTASSVWFVSLINRRDQKGRPAITDPDIGLPTITKCLSRIHDDDDNDDDIDILKGCVRF